MSGYAIRVDLGPGPVNFGADLTVFSGGFVTVLDNGIIYTTGEIIISSGGTVTVDDGGNLSATVVDNGTLFFDLTGSGDSLSSPLSGSGSLVVEGGGTLVISGGDAFTGTTTISGGSSSSTSGSTLELSSATAVGSGSIAFAGSGGILRIDGTTMPTNMPTNVISGFAPGDTIDLRGVQYDGSGGATFFETGQRQPNYVLQVVESGQTYALQLDSSQPWAGGFVLSADGAGGTDINVTSGSVPVTNYPSGAVTNYSTLASTPAPASKSPYLGVVDIQATFPGSIPFKIDLYGGTGFIIGPDAILTAAHVVENESGTASSISVYPGTSSAGTGNDLPGYALPDPLFSPIIEATAPSSSLAWKINEEYDFAIIDVPGANFSSGITFGLQQGFPGGTVNLTGYPSTVNGVPVNSSTQSPAFQTTQFNDIGTVTPDPAYPSLLDYVANMSGVIQGNSGGPLWVYNGNSVNAVGLVVTNNYALQLTSAVRTEIGSLETAATQIVHSGEILNVIAGQVISGVLDLVGGAVNVLLSGSVIDATVYGILNVLSGGSADPTTIYGGGLEVVSAGGTDTGALIGGGEQDLYGSAIGATIFTGSQVVESGGIASDTSVSGGTLYVFSGGTADPTTIYSGGLEVVSAGGTDSGAQISGGEQDVYGSAVGATVFAGSQVVEGGGTASVTTVDSGGYQAVYVGTVTGTTVNSGGYQVVNGGTASASGTIVNGGTQDIYNGGAVSDTTLNGGVQDLDGTAIGTIINSGGTEVVRDGGGAADTTINSDGVEDVQGIDDGAQISGGTQDVYGTTTNATVFTGSQVVESGGIASNIIISGGTVEVVSGGTIGGAVLFTSNSGTLQIDGPNAAGVLLPGTTISGFVPGDTIDLTGVSYDSGGSANLDPTTNVLIITENSLAYDLQLDPSQDFSGDYFHLSLDAGTGTDITESNTPCYCRGTLIRTGRGHKRVENLEIGDTVLTMSGAARPIKWIGRRGYDGAFVRGRKDILPICIKAGALDEKVPRRDLWISPHHAMYLKGVLIEARDLVNGVSIVQAARVDNVEYFHVELDTHDVIIAEGALSESFVDDDSRGMFQNAHEYRALYPDSAPAPDCAPAPARFYAPRLYRGDQVEAARWNIAQRAGVPYVPTQPQIEAAQAVVPRALVVDSAYPQIGHDGGANAVLDHVRALQAAGFAVSFLALRDRRGDTTALVSLGAAPLRLGYDVTLDEVFRRQQFDLVYLHRMENAAACLDLARRHGRAQIVYSVADLHHLRLKGQSAVEHQPARAQELAQQALKLGVLELSLAAAADSVITHSVTEAQWLRRAPGIRGTEKVHVVPWSVPAQPVQRPFRERSGIAFIGGFGHEPNVDAARWLVDEVMPLVRRQAPEIACFLAGSDMPDEVLGLRRPGVEVLGRVERLDELFERVRLTVAPLRFGAGVKDKVVRSLAAGLPCVGTPSAFDVMAQLPAVLLRRCLRKTARGLAEAIVAMHRDEERNTRSTQAGLDYINANFNAPRIDALIDEMAQPALDRHRARRLITGDPQGRTASDVTNSPQVTILAFDSAVAPAIANPAESSATEDTETSAILDVSFIDPPCARRRAV